MIFQGNINGSIGINYSKYNCTTQKATYCNKQWKESSVLFVLHFVSSCFLIVIVFIRFYLLYYQNFQNIARLFHFINFYTEVLTIVSVLWIFWSLVPIKSFSSLILSKGWFSLISKLGRTRTFDAVDFNSPGSNISSIFDRLNYGSSTTIINRLKLFR